MREPDDSRLGGTTGLLGGIGGGTPRIFDGTKTFLIGGCGVEE